LIAMKKLFLARGKKEVVPSCVRPTVLSTALVLKLGVTSNIWKMADIT